MRNTTLVDEDDRQKLHNAGFNAVGVLRSTQRVVFAILDSTYEKVVDIYELDKREDVRPVQSRTEDENVLLFVSPFHIRDDGRWEAVHSGDISRAEGLTRSGREFVAWGELRDWRYLVPKVQYQARPNASKKYGEMCFKIKQDLG